MRTYRITGPDGKEYSIDGPEGATREQVIQKIQERLSAQQQAPQTQQTKQISQPQPRSANQSLADRLLNSPVGGFVRGLRDIPDAGAQLITRGLEAAAPAGSGFEKWARGQRENVENINRQAEQDYRQNWRQGNAPGFDTGRIGGNIAATLPLAAVPGLNPATIAGGARLGAVSGALQPVIDTNNFADSKIEQGIIGGIGGAAGSALGKGISRLLRPVPKVPSAGQQIGEQAANRLGVQLTPGERTGSLGLQQLESVLERTPGSAGAMGRIRDLNQQAINRAAAKSIGESADDISETVFAAAKARLGKGFDDLSKNAQVDLGSDFVKSLTAIRNSNAQLGSFANNQVDDLVQKGIELASKGKLTGSAYQTIRSRLTDRASDAFRAGNTEIARALKTVRDGLDDAARSSMDDATKSAWDTIRRQYANLKVLEKGNVVNVGDVNPNLVANALRQYNPSAFKSGSLNGELMDIARYGKAFRPSVPNSGTPERTLMQNMLFGNPLTGLPIVAGSKAVQSLMFSPLGQAYLSKGLIPLSAAMESGLSGFGGLSGAALMNQENRR